MLTEVEEAPAKTTTKFYHLFCCAESKAAFCGKKPSTGSVFFTLGTEYHADDCSACVLEHRQWLDVDDEHHWSCDA